MTPTSQEQRKAKLTSKEIVERRKRRLCFFCNDACFFCNDAYTPGHKFKTRLYMLMGEEECDNDFSEEKEETREELLTQQQPTPSDLKGQPRRSTSIF